MTISDRVSMATTAVWGGEDESLVMGATQVPVVYSAAYGYPDVDAWLERGVGRKPGPYHSRNTTPTVHAFEEKVRLLEGAEAATSFASGMAAISNTLFTLLSPGDRVVSVKDTYGGTNKIFTEFLPALQYPGRAVRHDRPQADRGGNCPRLSGGLSGNADQPTLKVIDIARLAEAGHRAGAVVVATTRFAHRSTRARWSWARTWSFTAPRSSWAAMPTCWAASCAGIRSLSEKSTTTGRSRARRWIRWRLPADPRHEDAAPAHPPAERECAEDRAAGCKRSPRWRRYSTRGWRRTRTTTSPGDRWRGYGGVLSFMLRGGFAASSRCCRVCGLAHRAANLGRFETIAGPPATTATWNARRGARGDGHPRRIDPLFGRD